MFEFGPKHDLGFWLYDLIGLDLQSTSSSLGHQIFDKNVFELEFELG